jgi:hypothetical protein
MRGIELKQLMDNQVFPMSPGLHLWSCLSDRNRDFALSDE